VVLAVQAVQVVAVVLVVQVAALVLVVLVAQVVLVAAVAALVLVAQVAQVVLVAAVAAVAVALFIFSDQKVNHVACKVAVAVVAVVGLDQAALLEVISKAEDLQDMLVVVVDLIMAVAVVLV
jgi:hypothetical protein